MLICVRYYHIFKFRHHLENPRLIQKRNHPIEGNLPMEEYPLREENQPKVENPLLDQNQPKEEGAQHRPKEEVRKGKYNNFV